MKACWAVFYHSISTDEKLQHHCCPEGPDSLCKLQRALALGQDAPRHSPMILSTTSNQCLMIYANKNC